MGPVVKLDSFDVGHAYYQDGLTRCTFDGLFAMRLKLFAAAPRAPRTAASGGLGWQQIMRTLEAMESPLLPNLSRRSPWQVGHLADGWCQSHGVANHFVKGTGFCEESHPTGSLERHLCVRLQDSLSNWGWLMMVDDYSQIQLRVHRYDVTLIVQSRGAQRSNCGGCVCWLSKALMGAGCFLSHWDPPEMVGLLL